MAQNPNLVPTPIVNSRGVATTVHRKMVTPPKAVRIPPLVSPPDHSRELFGLELADAIVEELQETNSKLGDFTVDVPLSTLRKLWAVASDTEQLNKLGHIFRVLNNGEESDRRLLSDFLSFLNFESQTKVSIVFSNLDYIRTRPHNSAAITVLAERLIEYGIVKSGGDWKIPTLATHVRCANLYRDLIAKQNQPVPSDLEYYPDNAVFMAAVNRHADKLEKLFAYKEIRGFAITVDEQGFPEDTFDEEDFQLFLEQGAVAEGWL